MIPRIVIANHGIAIVLRPDGKLIFFELGLSPDPEIQRRQQLRESLHHLLFNRLFLTRDIPFLIVQGVF